jgi:hypothetical protein
MNQVGKDILILATCNQTETKNNHIKIFLRINLILTNIILAAHFLRLCLRRLLISDAAKEECR